MEIIKLENVNFTTLKNIYDLVNLNITINEGETYGILGAKNNGKTSFLTILGGLNSHTSGNMYLFGKNAQETNLDKYRAKNVDFLFSNNFLEEDQTVKENLEIIYAINNKNVNSQKIKDALNEVGLGEDNRNEYIEDLTELDKQKVILARALLKDSKIIIAKNPIKKLEEEEVDEFMDLLLKLCKKKNIALVISTESNYICKNLDHIYGMNKGNLNFIK